MTLRSRLFRLGLPAIALVGAGVGTIAATSNRPVDTVVAPQSLPPTQPSRTGEVIGATGVVEAEGRNVSIGASIAGVVSALLVTPGQQVEKGTPLFVVDARMLRAQVAVREADVAAARLSVAVADASVLEAQAIAGDRRAQSDRARAIADSRAISAEELAQRRFAAEAADAQLVRATAQARQSRGAVAQAEALLAQARTDLDRTIARSPQAGTVLQVNVRPGEFAPAGEAASALVVIGRTQTLHLRVDVDEVDVPRLMLGAPARFSVRGDARRVLTARFVRVEPLLVAKTSLSGNPGERVDTRVLQVLFAFDTADARQEAARPIAFVGQQVDVFLPARTLADGGAGQ